MKRFLIIAAACLWAGQGVAQETSEEDKGYLTNLIEENLSGAGREVNIVGFEGALSSEATIEQMTIADEEGIWLTLEDVVLQWNRSAILRGVIDVEQLRAAEIVVARAPITEEEGPSPEAQPFSLPELPVSISLDALEIDRIRLGASLLGEEIEVSLRGQAQLADGEGSAQIVAERLGEKTGSFEIDGSYVNETRVLDLLLRLNEGEEGIAATLLELPGRPSVRLEIVGNAPINDFTAQIALATNGEDRLAGQFELASENGAQEIGLDIAGDISPLFAADYAVFFGNSASLKADVTRGADGAISVRQLELDAGRVTLEGFAEVGADGWPGLIDLKGGITAVGGNPVLLPLSGPETYVDGLDLVLFYDRSISDDWRADITLDGLDRPGLRIAELRLAGGGFIRPPQDGQIPAFTANLNYGARGLALDDAGAQQAFGDGIEGTLAAEYRGGETTEITRLTLEGAGLSLNGSGTIAGPDNGFRTQAELAAEVAGLARFSTLAGRDLGGAADMNVVLDATPLEGLFDITIDAGTDDLSIGIAEVDRLLTGRGDLDLRVVRDTAGTRVETLQVRTSAASIGAEAELTSDGADASIDARLNQISLLLPDLSGPVTINGDVSQNAEGVISFDVAGTGPAATFRADGTVTEAEVGQVVRGDLRAAITDLSRYAALLDRPVAGAVDLNASGAFRSETMTFDGALRAATTDLATGIDRLDPLVAGQGRIAGNFARLDDGRFAVSGLQVTYPVLRLTGDATLSATGSNAADLQLVLDDAALIDPRLSGPMTLDVTAKPALDDATEALILFTGAGADLVADVVISSPANGREVSGTLEAVVADLSNFAGIAGRPIAGSVDLTATGSVLPDLSRFDTQLNVRSENLRTGIAGIDPLLAGTGRINATVGLEDGVLAVRTLEVTTREVSIVAALNGASGYGQGRFNASLRDVGVLTDQISGPVRATGSAALDENGNWTIDATGTGPGGLTATVDGQVRQDGTLDLDIDGSAPLALANAAIEPRRISGQADFALSVNGAPSLEAVSGRITVAGARLAAPTLGEALTDLTGAVTLTSGRAVVDLRGNVETGGSIALTGPVQLSGGLSADLSIALNEVVLRDPDLYRTSVNGTINVNGPLSGGALIQGVLNLGQTDVQVPSSPISSLGALPEVTHIAPPADVRRTLARAGLTTSGTETGDNGAESGGTPFRLDLTINAPSRIFIRGRGLDAELGGSLAIGGTTDNVVPVGRFSLIRGRIDILQQRFELTEGVATLQGDFEPFIRLVATTEADTGTRISIIVEGPAGSPEVRFVSVPELPQDEVLAQLIFGRDLDSISPLQAVQLASAISTLAGRGGGTLDSFRSGLGLDDFDVTTDEEGNAAVRAGAYLSDNVYTDVTINSEGETEINLNLDITSEFTAKGSIQQDGETSIGIFFERDY